MMKRLQLHSDQRPYRKQLTSFSERLDQLLPAWREQRAIPRMRDLQSPATTPEGSDRLGLHLARSDQARSSPS